jgi:hypothetical protein
MLRKDHYITYKGGLIRRARRVKRCDLVTKGIRCTNMILVGDKYLDSNVHNPRAANEHITLHYCTECAEKEMDL